MKDYEFAIDELRHMVKNFDYCNESFNQRCESIEDLVAVHRAWMASGWDIYPDQWTNRQVSDALRGVVPNWCEVAGELKPVYSGNERVAL